MDGKMKKGYILMGAAFFHAKKKKGEPMAKKKYLEWLESDNLTRLNGWARDGLTDQQIAHNIGINVATLYDWKKRFPNIDNALKKGKEVIDYEVENALLRSALEGNTTAQIFWLKNRRALKWREKQEVAVSGHLEHERSKLDDLLNQLNGGDHE